MKNIKANWLKENLKEKINESISNFSKKIFTELDEVYEKTVEILMGATKEIRIGLQNINERDIRRDIDLH